jgi:hypothetical protein
MSSRALKMLGLLGIALLALLTYLNAKMQAHDQAGLLSFEFARTGNAAAAMLSGWDASAERAARWAQWVDYAFLLVYAAGLTIAVRAAAGASARGGATGVARAAPFVVAAVWVGAASDAVQNTALLLILGRRSLGASALIAFVCGVVTVTMLATATVYLLVSWLVRRNRPAQPSTSGHEPT